MLFFAAVVFAAAVVMAVVIAVHSGVIAEGARQQGLDRCIGRARHAAVETNPGGGQRRRGAAMVLMRALVMAAQRENAALLTLEVRKSNTHAIDWYRRCGFLDMGIRPNFYTAPDEDALIMTKYLKKDET